MSFNFERILKTVVKLLPPPKKNWNVTVIFNPGPLAKDLASCYKTAEFITPIQSINFGFIFLGDLGTCTFM